MKTTEIEKIDVEHRVLTIGTYNAYVNFCPFCEPKIYLGLKDTLGFGTDKDGFVVEVSECPNCFEKSYHHMSGFNSYDIFKIFKIHNETQK